MFRFHRHYFVLIIYTLGLAIIPIKTPSMAAQTNIKPLINYVFADENGDGVNIQVFFNMASGNQLYEETIREAEIRFNDRTYPTEVIRAETPFFITLVLDASGSMEPVNAIMRQAAKQAVDTAPDIAYFSVIAFGDSVNTLQTFTRDKNAIKNAIDQVQSRPNAGTKLYDGAYQAVELTAQAEGRRAVILFTDGVDQETQNSPGRYSLRTLEDVTTLARERQVPIYTVGLESPNAGINAGELGRIANETGGLAETGSQNRLGALFQAVVDALSNQWMAEVRLYPPTAGTHDAQLVPILNDGSRTGDALFRFSTQDAYSDPFNLALAGPPTRDPATGDMQFNFAVVGGDRVQEITFTLADRDGVLADTQTFNSVPPMLVIPASALQDAGRYTLTARGIDQFGQPLELESFESDFTYRVDAPPEVEPTVNIIALSPTSDGATLTIRYIATGIEQLSGLDVRLQNEDGLDIDTDTISNLSPGERSFGLPTEGLACGSSYALIMVPVRLNGERGRAIERDFESSPCVRPVVQISPPRQLGDYEYEADIIGSDTETIQRLEQTLISEQGTIIDESNLIGVPESLRITLPDGSPSGAYSVQLRVTDPEEWEQLRIDPVGFEHIAPSVSFGQRLTNFLRIPWISAILLAALVLAGVFVFQQRRQRSQKASVPQGQSARNVAIRKDEVNNLPPIFTSPPPRPDEPSPAPQPPSSPPIQKPPGSVSKIMQEAMGPAIPVQTPTGRRPKSGTTDNLRVPTVPEGATPFLVIIIESSSSHPPKHIYEWNLQDRPRLQFGRVESYQGKPLGNNITFEQDPTVSGQHARFRYEEASRMVYLEDLGSANGTIVDDELMARKSGRVFIPNKKSVIKLGKTVTLIITLEAR